LFEGGGKPGRHPGNIARLGAEVLPLLPGLAAGESETPADR
jgi:hypothetical protein